MHARARMDRAWRPNRALDAFSAGVSLPAVPGVWFPRLRASNSSAWPALGIPCGVPLRIDVGNQ